MRYLVTLVQGLVIGLADVVPGVSGGTVALTLGMYARFINALRSLNLDWLPGLFKWIKSGFKASELSSFTEPLRRIHWSFLLPLGAGIMSAIVVGSRIIPPLMLDYPVAMFSLFFGLILASCWLPFHEMRRRGPVELLFVVIFAGLAWLFVGASAQPVMSPSSFSEQQPVRLDAFVRAHPSVYTPEEIYCPKDEPYDNHALRRAIHAESETAELAGRLDQICEDLVAAQNDPDLQYQIRVREELGRKDAGNPFNSLIVPAGLELKIPRPAHWFMFVAGFIAICAMVLPGISGSFLLLVFGVYFFLLTSLKGSVDSILRLAPNLDAISYAGIFSLGCLVGLASFARLMSWLFKRYGTITYAAMIGLMLGCLRAIWPFKAGDPGAGSVANVGPASSSELITALIFFAVGFIIVTGLTTWEISRKKQKAA